MDIDEDAIGRYPNVAVEAGSNPKDVMERYGVEPPLKEGDDGGEPTGER